MGSYNSQYESYYSSMVNRRRAYGSNTYNKYNSGFKLDSNFIIKRIVRDLIGVFALFFLIIVCKVVPVPQTTAAYNYSKQVIDRNFDYKSAYESVKNFNVTSIEDKVTDWVDTAKTKIMGGKTLKEKLKSDFMQPVEGTIMSHFGQTSSITSKEKKSNEGIDIKVKADAEIISPFEGKVKDCGEDADKNKYVILDHGNGIETKYEELKSFSVKKGDLVKKGQVIGKGGIADSNNAQAIHFELLIMGENKNPEDYLSFAK